MVFIEKEAETILLSNAPAIYPNNEIIVYKTLKRFIVYLREWKLLPKPFILLSIDGRFLLLLINFVVIENMRLFSNKIKLNVLITDQTRTDILIYKALKNVIHISGSITIPLTVSAAHCLFSCGGLSVI